MNIAKLTLATAEQDHFNLGCNPDTIIEKSFDLTFESATIEGLRSEISEFFSAEAIISTEKEELEIIVSRLEDEESSPATDFQIKEWKKNQFKLWTADYIFSVYEQQPIYSNEYQQ